MTLLDLQRALYRRLHFGDTPATEVTTRITMLLNQRHRALLTSPALRQLREGFGSLVSVAGQSAYAVPFGITKLTAVRDTANDRALGAMSLATYRRLNPDPASFSGTPDSYVPVGNRAIVRMPAAQGLWAVSSSAGDTTQNVIVTGALSSTSPRGYQQTSTTLLTGTTRVRLGGVSDTFDDVSSITLSAATAGSISIFDAAAAGNVIATIFAGRRTSRVYVLALHPTPGAALTYDIDYEHAIVDLANAWDEPLLPEDFHDILVSAVLMDEYEGRDDSRYATAEANYRKRLSDLKCHLYGHREATLPIPQRELAPLGSWFPFQTP